MRARGASKALASRSSSSSPEPFSQEGRFQDTSARTRGKAERSPRSSIQSHAARLLLAQRLEGQVAARGAHELANEGDLSHRLSAHDESDVSRLEPPAVAPVIRQHS